MLSGNRSRLALLRFQSGGRQTLVQCHTELDSSRGDTGRVPGSARNGLGLGLVQVRGEPGRLPREQIPGGRQEPACAKVPAGG